MGVAGARPGGGRVGAYRWGRVKGRSGAWRAPAAPGQPAAVLAEDLQGARCNPVRCGPRREGSHRAGDESMAPLYRGPCQCAGPQPPIICRWAPLGLQSSTPNPPLFARFGPRRRHLMEPSQTPIRKERKPPPSRCWHCFRHSRARPATYTGPSGESRAVTPLSPRAWRKPRLAPATQVPGANFFRRAWRASRQSPRTRPGSRGWPWRRG